VIVFGIRSREQSRIFYKIIIFSEVQFYRNGLGSDPE